MNLSLIKRIVIKLTKNIYVQSTLVGLIVIVPFALYVVITNSIIAPLNTLSGWDTTTSRGSVVAKAPSDVNQQILPFRAYTKEALTRYHELPIWNTKSFAGDVFSANPINTVYSPINVLLFIVDIYTFQNIIVLLGIFLMAACMYLLLRHMSVSFGASILGAVAYSYAPFSIFWSIYGIISIPMAAIPLVLYLYSKWKLKNKGLNAYLFYIILTLGFIVYMGHIQIVLTAYVVLLLAVCYDLIISKLHLRRALYIVAGVLTAMIIGFAQIAPFLSQIPLSHRSVETTTVTSKPWDDRLTDLANIPTSYNLNSGPEELGTTARRTLSIGQIPGILMAIGVIALVTNTFLRRRTISLFYLFLFVFGALWQWNDFPQPLLNILSPTLKSLATDYFLPIALLAMSILAAYGLDYIHKLIFRKSNSFKLPIFSFSIIPVISVVVWSIPQLMLSKISGLDSKYYAVYYALIILALVYYVVRRNKQFSGILFIATIIIVALMQGWALYRVSQPIISHDILTIKSHQLNYITANSDPDPTIVDYIGPQESTLYNVSLINGYDSLYSSSLSTRVQAINYPAKTPSSYRDNALIINTVNKPVLFKNLGVTYTINNKPINGYYEVSEGVYKADQLTPLVYFALALKNQSQQQQLETIKTGDIRYHEVPLDGLYPIADSSSTATYSRTPNTLSIKTTSSTGGLLFIAQTYNKDWQATLDDGSLIPIIPAFYDFSAIVVPSGSHTINLKYAPQVAAISLGVSIIAIMGISVVFILVIRKGKRIK